jgi:hypothetical protein
MLKRILLCTTHHSAPTTTKSFTHAPLKKHSIDSAFLALAVVVLLLTIGAAAQDPNGAGSTGSSCSGSADRGFTCALGFSFGGNIANGAFGGSASPDNPTIGGLGNSQLVPLPVGGPSGPSWNLGMDAGPGLFGMGAQLPGGIGNRFMQFFRDEVIAWHQNYNSNQSVMSITAVGEAWSPNPPKIAIGIVPFEGPELPGAGEVFGPHDLVFGLDPEGPIRQLKTFQLEVGGGGGNRIVQLWQGRGEVGPFIDAQITKIAMGAPGRIRFNLDGLEGLTGPSGAYGDAAPIWDLFAGEAKYGTATTANELMLIKSFWRRGRLGYNNTTFYLKGQAVGAPW